MKKIVFILAIICLALIGCNQGLDNESTVDISPNTVVIATEKVEENVQIAENTMPEDTMPVWVSDYLVDNLMLDEQFYMVGNSEYTEINVIKEKLLFPEVNVLSVTTAGEGNERKVINNKEKILEIIEILENVEMVENLPKDNDEVYVLETHLKILFLNTNGDYMLLNIYSFSDDKHSIQVNNVNSDNNIELRFQSNELTELLKELSGVRFVEEVELTTAIDCKVVNSKTNQTYELTVEEAVIFRDIIISNLDNKTAMCAGPFDIELRMNTSNTSIFMLWANDSCPILKIEGIAYGLNDEDALIVQDMLKSVGGNALYE